MSQAELSPAENGRVAVNGDLTFTTAAGLYSQLDELLKGHQQLVLDFSAVERIDSAALSLVLCMRRRAQAAQTSLSIEHPPADLQSIADLVGLKELLTGAG